MRVGRSAAARAGAVAVAGLIASGAAVPTATATSAASRSRPTQHFRSAPDLRPPPVTASSDRDRTSGDIFLAPQNTPQVGPMIINGDGQLVWFDPLKGGSATYYASNLEVQHYQGHPVLTWWQGEDLGHGEDVIMNSSYRTIAVVHAGNGYQPDLHEFQITPQGNALIDALRVRRADLKSVGGPAAGALLDNVVQEIDIKTDKLLWQWDAAAHIPISASYEPYSSKRYWYDAFHLNSIQQLPGGNLLISVRNTWSVYEISRRTGQIIWTLGGKNSDFKVDQGAQFEWQHDARMHPRGILSVFDDASDGTAGGQEEAQSSAKLLRIDTSTRTVSLVHSYTHTPPLLTSAAGDAQVLSNGNVFVGWGQQPEFSEYSRGGRQLFSGSLPFGVGSYRAFRFPWVGKPQTRPALAVSRSTRGVRIYASWNGATQVKTWRVIGGSNPHRLKTLGVKAPWSGFEARIQLASRPRYVAVQALGQSGKVLGTSASARG